MSFPSLPERWRRHLVLLAVLVAAHAAPSRAGSITTESGNAFISVEYLAYDGDFEYIAADRRDADPTSPFDIGPYRRKSELHGEVGPGHVGYHGYLETSYDPCCDVTAGYQLDLSFTGGSVQWQGSASGCLEQRSTTVDGESCTSTLPSTRPRAG